MKDYRDIILRPVITEKTMQLLADNNTYTFEVVKNTNKVEVAKAIENLFGVNVENVNISNTKAKKKRVGRHYGVVNGYKKAIVKLKDGQKIDLFGEEESK